MVAEGLAAVSVDHEIHRNTLNYRLEKIRRAIPFDLEEPAQRLRVEAALRFLELRRRHEARG